jgi:murein DD-endopeptidase MepM/ murein hydrolase activator NlpD
MRRYPSAWVLWGAIVFSMNRVWAWDVPYSAPISSIPVAASTAPLSETATGAMQIEEPFLPPLSARPLLIVSGFGKREVPGQPKEEMHEGVDYSASPGALVRASRAGKVLFVGFSTAYVSRTNKNDKHRLVMVRHADGKSTRYVHLNIPRVRPGQEIQAGQVIGTVSESDEWTEPVLHFEIRGVQGQPIDPEAVVMQPEEP